MSVSTSGFALRINGTCPATGVDCGATVHPYRACCPADSFCPSQSNVDCCPTSANCTSILVQNPQCANQTWDLYDNNGYFCCEQKYTGYASAGKSDGCAEPGYGFKSGEVLLSIISTGAASPTSASTTSSSTGTLTPTSTPPPKSSNPGAIAGGVIGGVVVITLIVTAIWYFCWRKRSNQAGQHAIHEELVGLQNVEGRNPFKKPSEFVDQQDVSELGGDQRYAGRPSELWDPHTVSELG